MPILTSQLPTLYKNDYCVLKGQFFRPNEAFPSNTMQTALIVKIIDPNIPYAIFTSEDKAIKKLNTKETYHAL